MSSMIGRAHLRCPAAWPAAWLQRRRRASPMLFASLRNRRRDPGPVSRNRRRGAARRRSRPREWPRQVAAGAASAGSKTTLARWAIRSTRADSTPPSSAEPLPHDAGRRRRSCPAPAESAILECARPLVDPIWLRPNLQVTIPDARCSRPWREPQWQDRSRHRQASTSGSK